MKTEITKRHLQSLSVIALNKHDEMVKQEETTKDEALFITDLKSVLKQCKPLYEEYIFEVEQLRIKNCLVDEKTGKVIKDGGEFKYNKEGESNFNKELKSLNEETVVLHARIRTGNNLKNKFTFDEYSCFEGVLIDKDKEEENEL